MSFDSESTKQQLSQYVAELVESGELTSENYTKNAVTSKLLTKFMDGKNLPRPKVRPIWEETIKAAFGASQPKPAKTPEAEDEPNENEPNEDEPNDDESNDKHESSLNEFEQMVKRRVHTTVRCQSHEMQLLASLLCIFVSLLHLWVLRYRTVGAGAVDFYEVLVHDASRTDVKVTYLRVTHLSVRQTNVLA